MTKDNLCRESWQELREKIDQRFLGDHGRPKKHIHLSRDDWKKIKAHASSECPNLDEEAIARLLTPID